MTTPFHDLGDYLAVPRVTGLRLSPDGTWLAASVATVSADRKKMLSSIWRIDPAGGPPRRLTRSAEGEASPRFLPDGSLVFVSKRPDPDGSENGSRAKPALWLPRLVASGREVEACARFWNGEHVLLRGADVSRRKLAQQLVRNPAVVHFATHFLEASDRTAAMIPLGLGGGNETEILPALEISHWRIHAGLVVLSGCDSAAGATLRGAGLLGLTRAWLTAGARSVVGSRWPTPDEDGALFRAFYGDLGKHSREGSAEALRAAQIEMLRSGGWRARPRYWGAYFVVGIQ